MADDARKKHDNEIIDRTAQINDLHVASYYWQLERDGVVFLREFDECDEKCETDPHPEGHLHRIAEWPGAPKPLVIGTQLAYDEDHNPVERDATLPIFKATESFEPYTLVAVPVTLDHQKLPPLKYEVKPGDSVIWGHRIRTHRHFVDDADRGRVFHEDTLMVGLRSADGSDDITIVYPDGETANHQSYDDAFAHSRA